MPAAAFTRSLSRRFVCCVGRWGRVTVEMVSLVVGIIAVVPILGAEASRLLRWRRHHSILRFARRGPLDVVIASTHTEVGAPGAVQRLPTSGWGQVLGVSFAWPVLSARYPKKDVRVSLSAHTSGLGFRDDLIMLGGPLTNAVSRAFLEALSEQHRTSVEFDIEGPNVRVPGQSIGSFDLEIQDEVDGVPAKDLCLIVVAPNPWETRRRAVLCCGLTTYGTAAAASLLFYRAVPANRDFWKKCGIAPRRESGFGLLFVAHLDAAGSLVGESQVHAFPLDP